MALAGSAPRLAALLLASVAVAVRDEQRAVRDFVELESETSLNSTESVAAVQWRGTSPQPEPLTLIMSDVDDTLTCPAVGRGGVTAKLAGMDTCDGEHAIKHGQIYFGSGTFIYLVANRDFAFESPPHSATLKIISANPFATGYPHIANYLDLVSQSCKTKSDKLLGLSSVTVHLDEVRGGTTFTSVNGHMVMGVRKLHSILKQWELLKPSKIVWLGDTGQGDVCAGVCFVDRSKCPDAFKAVLQEWGGASYYPDNIAFLNGELDEHLPDVPRYAFLHKVGPLESKNTVKQACFDAAKTIPHIVFFGHEDHTARQIDYLDAMYKAAALGLIHPDPQAAVNLINRLYESADSKDCIDPSAWTLPLYWKHKA